MSDSDYQSGRLGVPTTKTDMGSVADNIRGQMDASFEAAQQRSAQFAGQDHRHTFHLLLLMALAGLVVFSLWYLEILQWKTMPLVGLWVGSTVGSYIFLRLLPGWLSGSIMGLLTGSIAAYLGWFYGNLYWSAGAGMGAGVLMYFLFSRLE